MYPLDSSIVSCLSAAKLNRVAERRVGWSPDKKNRAARSPKRAARLRRLVRGTASRDVSLYHWLRERRRPEADRIFNNCRAKALQLWPLGQIWPGLVGQVSVESDRDVLRKSHALRSASASDSNNFPDFADCAHLRGPFRSDAPICAK